MFKNLFALKYRFVRANEERLRLKRIGKSEEISKVNRCNKRKKIENRSNQ